MDANFIRSARSITATQQTSLNPRSPSIQLLRNEQMVTMLSTAGAGYSHYDRRAITRWQADATRDADGYYLFIRDLDDRSYWSATRQPTRLIPDDYCVEFEPGLARYFRTNHQIRTEMTVFLSINDSVEFRRISVSNNGNTARRIELTSYAELVLQDANADLGHLAYSKLFVETWCTDTGMLIARRRPRESGAKTLAACHYMVTQDGPKLPEFDTCRATFLGRGNSTANSRAMHSMSPLAGRLGSVLDPIFSLRHVLMLPPGESASVTFALMAGPESESLTDSAARYQTPEAVAMALANAESTDNPHHFAANDSSSLLNSASSALYNTPYTRDGNSSGNLHNGQSSISSDDDRNAFLQHYRIDPPVNYENVIEGEGKCDLASKGTAATLLSQSTINGAVSVAVDAGATIFTEPLQFENGLGGFSQDGSEYVIRLRPDETGALAFPPMPWANVIANEQIGFVTTETAAGFSWAGNSRLNRLTPWHNDLISDPHGEAIYVSDNENEEFWSVSAGPIRQSVEYEVRHGTGYSRFRHSSHGFDHDLVQFVACNDPLKISWVRMTNTSGRPRLISLTSYHHWDLTDGNTAARSNIVSSLDEKKGLLFAENEYRGVFADNSSFAGLLLPTATESLQFTCDRFEFLGQHGELSSPHAIANGRKLSGRVGRGFDQCAAASVSVEVAAGETIEFAVLLGETATKQAAFQLVERFNSPVAWSDELEQVRTGWNDRLSAVQVETPSPSLDLMINRWLPYQNLSCRIWGRSSLYQSGGAYGYRDQLQDAAALVHHLPDLTRQQIMRHAAHQFCEGDVMHWWHPPHDLGIRTTFSDDLLWLPLFAAEYVETTGDKSLWNEGISFLSGPQVPAGEAEIMTTPTISQQVGSLYEHCCRALDRGLTSGRNGLPLMGCGDWNDGMNRVGIGGSGESVWMAFFIDYVLAKMLPVCEELEDRERLDRYLSYREELRIAIHDSGWDGGWYRRAYFDDGTPLGTAAADECQIDALVQAWAVLSGADTPERAAKAMDAAANRLIDQKAGIIQLLDPPFDKMPDDPGYIKGYLPGVRENGGQYTHGVLWFIRAMAELGHGSRAVQLLEMISPISHTKTPKQVATYQAEPYVIAADVYSQPPHAGRAGWSWYTGSAGWMWRVAVESILGVRLLGGKALRIDPRISKDWPVCRVSYRLPDSQTSYKISIRNPQGRESNVTRCELDGVELAVVDGVALIPLSDDGLCHQVVVTL